MAKKITGSTNIGDKAGPEFDEDLMNEPVITLEKRKMIFISLRNRVMFPNRPYSLEFKGEDAIAVIEAAKKDGQLFFTLEYNRMQSFLDKGFIMEKTADTGESIEAVYATVGVTAIIDNISDARDGGVNVSLNTIARARLLKLEPMKMKSPIKIAEVEEMQDDYRSDGNTKIPGSVEEKKTIARKLFYNLLFAYKTNPKDVILQSRQTTNTGFFVDLLTSHSRLSVEDQQDILSTIVVNERLDKYLIYMQRELEKTRVLGEIEEKLQNKLSQNQKEYFLREQIKVIKTELGDDDFDSETGLSEFDEFRKRAKEMALPEKVYEKVSREIDRLSRISPSATESAVTRNYINWILDLPWNVYTEDNTDLENAKKTLDEDHYGLDKVKERILEYMAVHTLNEGKQEKSKGQIICLVGPPGVGKTSVAKSIARALERKYVRISLGGVSDEAEIRGHRRTYVGSIPGRIIYGLKEAGSSNPLILFDEIDKIGTDRRGDPASALLEVLDPEQNKYFTDHYMELPFDLSKVMFIATANTTSTIPRALLDRMQLIQISGYTEDEKLMIAKKFLLPKQIEENGIPKKYLTISDSAILDLIRGYTRESGVRNLERSIGDVCRKAAVRLVKGNKKGLRVTGRSLAGLIGNRKFKSDLLSKEDQVGIVTGLAWTAVGGETLSVEVNVLDGGSGKLKITGQIGDVMRESAEAALSYTRTIADKYGVSLKDFTEKDIHIHVPEGAIPKDGPSAGVTMATALLSSLSGRKVDRFVAMTGEVTLRGRVLPIGGLKEKTLAALRFGIKKVLYPADNQSDCDELPDVVKEGLELIPVKNMEDVLKHALVKEGDAKKSAAKKAAPKTKKTTKK